MIPNGLPTAWESIFAIWNRNFMQFKKTWAVSAFWIVLEPMFLLGALGYGLGAYIPQINGMSYLEFFFPALLCTSSMTVAFFETTYANFTKLSYSKLYHTMLLAPFDTKHLLAGEILWAATKAMFSVVGILIVAALLGALGSPQILFSLPIIFLSSLIFAVFGMIVTSKVQNYDQIIYPSSGLIIPLSLFSGTYFPLEAFPKSLQVLAYLSPLTHAVSATRSLQEGKLTAMVVLNIACLVLVLTILWRIAARMFERRLID